MDDVRPTAPWGTITAGTIAVLTAVAVAATQYGGLAVPLRALGPGAIIVIGMVILGAGLLAVLRSATRERRAVTQPPPEQVTPSSAGQVIAPPDGAPVDPAQGWIEAELAASSGRTTEIPAREQEPGPAGPAILPETSAAQGSAADPPDRGHDGGSAAQSSH